jgi:hypothetical protein
MIHNEDCNNVLIAGNLNCHFAKKTRFPRAVRNHFQELNLSILWEIPDCRIHSFDFTHQFVSENVSSLSTIDHFAGNPLVVNAIAENGVLHHHENTSNHSQIFVKIDVCLLQVNVEQCKYTTRTSWGRASEEEKVQYKSAIASKINQMQTPKLLFDIAKCFDSLWLKGCLIDLYEAGLDNSNLNLLYEGNRECLISVKTPSGQTERISIKEIVMQGSVWGPLCCSTTMHKLGQKSYRTGSPMYTYKGIVSVF